MKAALNRMHFPVTTLGFGRRVGVWLQGCSIRCPGCVSRDTWEADDARYLIDIEEITAAWARWLPLADGLTISGGEPFDQPDALLALMQAWRAGASSTSSSRTALPPPSDILVFTGYAREEIVARYPQHVAALDVLISDPYDAGAGDTLALRGSDNQRVMLMTAPARERYPLDINTLPWSSDKPRRLDVVHVGDDLWMAGIPRRGEVARLQALLRERGLSCTTSQHPLSPPVPVRA